MSQSSWYVKSIKDSSKCSTIDDTNNYRNRKPQSNDIASFTGEHNNVSGEQPTDGSLSTNSFSSLAIPPNKKGKHYTMEEVFQVWAENKDSILTAISEFPVKANENYKLSSPGQIYHLDLQPKSTPSRNEDATDISQSLENLSMNDNLLDRDCNIASYPPPGMIPKSQESSHISSTGVLTSDKIEWFYLDASANEQGPFNGDMMQEWLSDGYLNLDLRIRRKEDSSYQTLKDFCEKLQNYIHPFKVPLPDLVGPANFQQNPQDQQSIQFSSQPTSQHQSQFSQFLSNGQGTLGTANMRLNSSMNTQSNIFGNDFMGGDRFSSPLTPVAATSFSNTSANQFGIDGINPGIAFSALPQLNTMPSLLQQQLHQQQPVIQRTNSGWGIDPSSNGLINSNPSTPVSVIPSQMSQATPMSPWLSDVQSLSRVSSPFIPATSLTKSSDNTDNQSIEVNSDKNGGDNVLNDIHSSVVTDILREGDEEQFNELNSEKDVIGSEQNTAIESVPEENNGKFKPVEMESQSTFKPSKPSQQKLAPWALASNSESQSSSTKPALTMKEIQLLQAEKLEKQKQLQNELKNEQSANPWNEEKAQEKVPHLPKTSSWVTNSVPTVTKKTLAEIQREEAEAKSKAVLNSTTKPTLAHALANSIPKDDGNWTTVSAKKPAVKKSVQIVNTTTSALKSSPQVLRSVSAPVQSNSSINATTLREDFLVWARSSMTNLYPTVSKDELLDIFITLPLNSPDSSQLISETIYSSSATMDGRRFAQEFLKRRNKVELQIGSDNSSSWSDAIVSSADKVARVDEDGWSTSVKPKKKGKKY